MCAAGCHAVSPEIRVFAGDSAHCKLWWRAVQAALKRLFYKGLSGV